MRCIRGGLPWKERKTWSAQCCSDGGWCDCSNQLSAFTWAGSRHYWNTIYSFNGVGLYVELFAAFGMAELNALMPNLTGGLAQYTLACVGPFITILIMVGGYLFGNTIVASVECAMFGNTLLEIFPHSPIPSVTYCIVVLLVLIVVNLKGVDLFAKVQNVVAYGLIGSLVILGVIGAVGAGTGKVVDQPAVVKGDFNSVISMCGLAFSCLLPVNL